MRKNLMIGLAVTFVSVLPAANALDGCPNMGLNNGHGSPPVVSGTTATAFVNMPPFTDVLIYLDGNFILDEDNSSGSTWSAAVFNVPLGSYGQHTLQDSLDWDCTLNFSNVPAGHAPAPSAPALSSPQTSVRSNSPHTLTWTVSSGKVDHYTISRGTPGNPEQTYTLPAGTNSQVLTSTASAVPNRVVEFMVHACSSSDESSCSAWSNPVDIAVTTH